MPPRWTISSRAGETYPNPQLCPRLSDSRGCATGSTNWGTFMAISNPPTSWRLAQARSSLSISPLHAGRMRPFRHMAWLALPLTWLPSYFGAKRALQEQMYMHLEFFSMNLSADGDRTWLRHAKNCLIELRNRHSDARLRLSPSRRALKKRSCNVSSPIRSHGRPTWLS
jgi:hypothetical protein